MSSDFVALDLGALDFVALDVVALAFDFTGRDFDDAAAVDRRGDSDEAVRLGRLFSPLSC
ncbi:MAG: hypothetical protein ACTIC1_16550 [Brevibacterium sp.]